MFSLHKKSSCYFDTHFSHPLFVLAAFAAAIVVCGVVVVVVVVVVGGLGLGGFGGFGAVFFFFPSSPLLWLSFVKEMAKHTYLPIVVLILHRPKKHTRALRKQK